ncbi:hypothetical protein V2G26_006487 [Clonostachys chloroleuca]
MIRPLRSRPLATACRASCIQPTRWFCAARPRLSEKLLYPENRTASQHRDLPTFLAYAKRTGLDEKSTVFVGTHYEYTIAGTLSRYGFSLQRVGGASDCGVDLLGTWTPPKTRRAMRTLVQCKAGAQRAGPNLIRELEGAFVGAPVGWRGPGAGTAGKREAGHEGRARVDGEEPVADGIPLLFQGGGSEADDLEPPGGGGGARRVRRGNQACGWAGG